jgi:hypothetical protein
LVFSPALFVKGFWDGFGEGFWDGFGEGFWSGDFLAAPEDFAGATAAGFAGGCLAGAFDTTFGSAFAAFGSGFAAFGSGFAGTLAVGLGDCPETDFEAGFTAFGTGLGVPLAAAGFAEAAFVLPLAADFAGTLVLGLFFEVATLLPKEPTPTQPTSHARETPPSGSSRWIEKRRKPQRPQRHPVREHYAARRGPG